MLNAANLRKYIIVDASLVYFKQKCTIHVCLWTPHKYGFDTGAYHNMMHYCIAMSPFTICETVSLKPDISLAITSDLDQIYSSFRKSPLSRPQSDINMADMSMAAQYEALSKLLQPTPEEGSNESRKHRAQSSSSSSAALTVVDPIHCTVKTAQRGGKGHPSNALNGIWEDTEVEDQVIAGPSQDPRETPRFEFLYKQAVTCTDAFLGMMDKDASSACCEDLELRIDLPQANSLSELDLDVQPLKILLASPAYLLSLPLPHKINEKQSSAKWIAKKKQLTLTMRIVRDL